MKNNKKGFTLVELVIVVAVMAVLVAVAIPTVKSVVGTAETTVAKTNARTIESQIKLELAAQVAGKRIGKCVRFCKNGRPDRPGNRRRRLGSKARLRNRIGAIAPSGRRPGRRQPNHPNEILKEKCLRVFASKDKSDKGVFKLKAEGKVVVALASENTNVTIAANNIPNVYVQNYSHLSVYDLINADMFILTEETVKKFEEELK